MRIFRWKALGFCLIFLSSCASLPAHRARLPEAIPPEDGYWIGAVLPVAQDRYQCGPAALESVFRYWGRDTGAEEISRAISPRGSRGVLNIALARYAQEQGFWQETRRQDWEQLRSWVRRGVPPIVMLQIGPRWVPVYHFVVLRGFDDRTGLVYANTGHPETRAMRYSHFLERWKRAGHWTLLLSPPERVDWELETAQAIDLGLLLEKLQRLEAAERWYRKALEQDPTNVPARFNLANVHRKRGRWKEAKQIYEELFEEQLGWAAAGNNLAWIHLERGNSREAARILEKALQAGAERRHDLLDTLGQAYMRLKQPDKARACFLEAQERRPP